MCPAQVGAVDSCAHPRQRGAHRCHESADGKKVRIICIWRLVVLTVVRRIDQGPHASPLILRMDVEEVLAVHQAEDDRGDAVGSNRPECAEERQHELHERLRVSRRLLLALACKIMQR